MRKSGFAGPAIMVLTFVIYICTKRFASRTAGAGQVWDRLVWPGISRPIFRENSLSILRRDESCLAKECTENARQVGRTPITVTAEVKVGTLPQRPMAAPAF